MAPVFVLNQIFVLNILKPRFSPFQTTGLSDKQGVGQLHGV